MIASLAVSWANEWVSFLMVVQVTRSRHETDNALAQLERTRLEFAQLRHDSEVELDKV